MPTISGDPPPRNWLENPPKSKIYRPHYDSDPIASIWNQMLNTTKKKKKITAADEEKNFQCLTQCRTLEGGMITYDRGLEAFLKWFKETEASLDKAEKKRGTSKSSINATIILTGATGSMMETQNLNVFRQLMR